MTDIRATLRARLDAAVGSEQVLTEASDVGEFTFDGVEPGRYDIHVVGGGREIVLADVPVALG